MAYFDKDEFEKSLENYRTGWNDIADPIAEIRRLRGANEDKDFEPQDKPYPIDGLSIPPVRYVR